MRAARLAALAVLIAGLIGVLAPPAGAQMPPGVDALVTASARGRTTALFSPHVRTGSPQSLLLAFVIAGGSSSGERVSRISGNGLHWSPLTRSDGRLGAVEVWQARARRRLTGTVIARLSAAAYPASITVVAYGGSAAYVAARVAAAGHASTPRLALHAPAGSLEWTAGLGQGQRSRGLASGAVAGGRRLAYHAWEKRSRTGSWLTLAALPTAQPLAAAAGASWARSWNLIAVDVVVPALKRLIEEGQLTAFGSSRIDGVAAASVLPRNCSPLPYFEVGVQDDPVFLGRQPAMSPQQGFELSSRVFSARLLRLNLSWGEVRRYGWAPYDRAVQMARERCWAVHLTIMPTPVYAEGWLPSELSGRNQNLGLFASFSAEIARRYAGEVEFFALGNEPNEGKFMAVTGNIATDMAHYDRLYMAGYNAIKSIDPGAQVIAGELSDKFVYEWLANVAALPNNGVSFHPYGLTKVTGQFVGFVAPTPLLVSEDGVPASQPNQLEEDFEREEFARRAGAREFVFYQLARADATERFWWNTGIA